MAEFTGAAKTFHFGYALACLKEGKKVARPGWNGKGMWLTMIRLGAWALHPKANPEVDEAELEQLPWIGMKTADNKFVPWTISQTDMLAEDWEVVE